ncbi:hypothetical protein VNO77_23339 [Canavalia gladiata]|uniref:Uncharacterized protein n=1 Tax=Canavalia gladiata TaxID=3824 RepID=A0AAN9L4S2_CANGL
MSREFVMNRCHCFKGKTELFLLFRKTQASVSSHVFSSLFSVQLSLLSLVSVLISFFVPMEPPISFTTTSFSFLLYIVVLYVSILVFVASSLQEWTANDGFISRTETDSQDQTYDFLLIVMHML